MHPGEEARQAPLDIGTLLKLPDKQELKRIIRFGAVGASGVVVNAALFWLGVEVLFTSMSETGRHSAAGALAVGLSILTNFLLNDAWTWRDRRKGGTSGLLHRLLKYYIVAGVAGGVQIGVMLLLTTSLGLWEHLANLVGIGAGIGINFFVNNLWTFRADEPEPTPQEPEALPEHS
jgi:dolichol-phosphate mannosyltransferase